MDRCTAYPANKTFSDSSKINCHRARTATQLRNGQIAVVCAELTKKKKTTVLERNKLLF